MNNKALINTLNRITVSGKESLEAMVICTEALRIAREDNVAKTAAICLNELQRVKVSGEEDIDRLLGCMQECEKALNSAEDANHDDCHDQ